MVWIWVLLVGFVLGVLYVKLGKKAGELFKKLMSLSHFNVSFEFHDDKQKELKSGERKQLED